VFLRRLSHSGTGILITQRIEFGTGGVERHYAKCLDYETQPLEHYKALIKALARLAGTHKAGRLPSSVGEQFPFDPSKLTVSNRTPYTAKQLQNRVARFADFAARFPQLLPKNITSSAFISRVSEEVARFPEHEGAIREFLRSRPELIALCHWNANVDNAWFRRNARGELQCGLLDWGHVSQMNVAMSLWGSLSGPETSLWDNHLDELLALFVAEFRACGGPVLDVQELKLHLELYIAIMGLAWLLDSPPLTQAHAQSGRGRKPFRSAIQGKRTHPLATSDDDHVPEPMADPGLQQGSRPVSPSHAEARGLRHSRLGASFRGLARRCCRDGAPGHEGRAAAPDGSPVRWTRV
jgi:hypothetical protein